jgi:Glycosyl hydrolase 108
MAAANRKPSFLATMAWEGRDCLSLDPRDAGNWTGGKIGAGKLVGSKFGVSAKTAARCFPGKAMAEITADDALKVFIEGYWVPIGAETMAAGLDHCVSDDAYNAGPSGALGRWKRIGGARASDSIAAIHAYSQLRLSFLEALRSWRLFRRGWAARVAGVEAESLKMAHAAGAMPLCWFAGPGDRFAAASIAADDLARKARDIALSATSIALLAPIVLARFGFISTLVSFVAAFIAAHQFWTTRIHMARREALGAAADEANGIV